MEVGGRSILSHHVERLKSSGYPVVVATTTNTTDDPIIEAAAKLGVEAVRGSEDDVLSRFADAIKTHHLDAVVRVTSDCPLLDGAVVRDGVERFLQAHDEQAFLSNTIDRTFPRGFDFEVMSARRLLEADAQATAPHQREHVTPWLYESPDTSILQLRREDDASNLRITLDTTEDFALIKELVERHDAASLDAEQIISLLRAHPELVALNAHIEQKKLED